MDVKNIALRIAEDICMFGHYQGSKLSFCCSPFDPTAKCCVYANPTLAALDDSDYLAAYNALRASELTVLYNDSLPTETVVAKLREIAGVTP